MEKIWVKPQPLKDRIVLSIKLRGLKEEIAKRSNRSLHTVHAYFNGRTNSPEIRAVIEEIVREYEIE